MLLTKANGPTCPYCGCTQTVIALPAKPGNPKSWFRETGGAWAICQHCYGRFTPSPTPASGPEVETFAPPLEISAAPLEWQEPAIAALRGPAEPEPGSPGPPAVSEVVCPDCGSPNVFVRSSPANVRYYGCRNCRMGFKTAKTPLRRARALD
jgi:hypothetical protein